jgi:hypothetical protein
MAIIPRDRYLLLVYFVKQPTCLGSMLALMGFRALFMYKTSLRASLTTHMMLAHGDIHTGDECAQGYMHKIFATANADIQPRMQDWKCEKLMRGSFC